MVTPVSGNYGSSGDDSIPSQGIQDEVNACLDHLRDLIECQPVTQLTKVPNSWKLLTYYVAKFPAYYGVINPDGFVERAPANSPLLSDLHNLNIITRGLKSMPVWRLNLSKEGSERMILIDIDTGRAVTLWDAINDLANKPDKLYGWTCHFDHATPSFWEDSNLSSIRNKDFAKAWKNAPFSSAWEYLADILIIFAACDANNPASKDPVASECTTQAVKNLQAQIKGNQPGHAVLIPKMTAFHWQGWDIAGTRDHWDTQAYSVVAVGHLGDIKDQLNVGS